MDVLHTTADPETAPAGHDLLDAAPGHAGFGGSEDWVRHGALPGAGPGH